MLTFNFRYLKHVWLQYFLMITLFIMVFAGCISVPRTGAVAYELGFKSLFSSVSIVLFIIGYFAIALYFSLDINLHNYRLT